MRLTLGRLPRFGAIAATSLVLLAGLIFGLLAGLLDGRASAAALDSGGANSAAQLRLITHSIDPEEGALNDLTDAEDGVSAQSQADTPGRSAVQTFVPVLGRSGDAPCANQLQVQNMGAQTSKAVLLLWGEPGECGAQAAGPARVLCTGLIAPGTSWLIPPADLGADVYSAVVYSFNTKTANEAGLTRGHFPPDDLVADILCEHMFFELPRRADTYSAFKQAFDTGASWLGLQLDRTYGSPLAVSLLRECEDSVDRSESPADVQVMGIPADRLGTALRTIWTYRLPLLDGTQSRVYVQNAGVDCVEIEFGERYPVANCNGPRPLRPCLGPQSLAPGEHFEFDRAACGQVVGMASLELTASGPLAIVVDSGELGGGRAGWSVLEPSGSDLLAPLVFEADTTWQVNVIVQNHDDVLDADVKLFILDRSGDVVSTLLDTVCPGNMRRIALPRPPELDPYTGSLRLISLGVIDGNGPPVPGAEISAQLELRRSQGGTDEVVQYAFVADEPNSQLHVDQGLIALPRVRKLADAPATRLAIQNTVGKPGFTDFIVYIFDANGLMDFVCQKLQSRQVEYIDLANWGYVNTGFQGSFVVSASFWEHFVYDAQGNKIGNPVSLNAVAGQRAPLGPDPGREAFAVTGLRFAPGSTDWGGPAMPICPGGGPLLRTPTPEPGTPATPGHGTPVSRTPSPTPGPGTASATAGPGTPSPAPPALDARQLHLPQLGAVGGVEECSPQIVVQNIGGEPSKVILITWAEPSECGPASRGPQKVECSGLITPGSAWTFMGAQMPAGAQSGALFSFTTRQLSELGLDGLVGHDDVAADFVCEQLFATLPGDAAVYADFKRAYDTGGLFAPLPMDKVKGAPMSALVQRDCLIGGRPGARTDYMGVSGAELGAAAVQGKWQIYRMPLPDVTESQTFGRLWLQNPGAECVEVELSKLAMSSTPNCASDPPSSDLGSYQIPAGERILVDFEHSGSAAGTIVVRASAPVAMVLEQGSGGVGRSAGSFAVNRHPAGELWAPLALRMAPGWKARVVLQDHAAPGSVEVFWQDASGASMASERAEICHEQMRVFEMPPALLSPSAWSGSLRVLSSMPSDQEFTGYVEIYRDDQTERLTYPLTAGASGVVAIPSLSKAADGATAPSTEISLLNAVRQPGFTDFSLYLFDQNGLLDFVCMKLDAGAVEHIDLRGWGLVNQGFRGSGIVSATYWEHSVTGAGGKTYNPVGLVATSAELARPGSGEVGEATGDLLQSLSPYEAEALVSGLFKTNCPSFPTPTPTRPSPTPDVATPTAPRPSRIYLPLILRDAESWPTGFILLVETSPDAPIPLARPIPSFDRDGSSSDLAAARRIGSLALGSLRAQRDAVAILRYDRSAELVLLTDDPEEAIAALDSLAAVGPRATTRPDLGLAAVSAAGQELRETMDRPDQALLIFIDGASSSEHLQRAIARAARLRAEGLAIFVVGQAISGEPEGLRSIFVDSLTSIAGRADRVAVWDPAQPESLDAVLDRTRSWGARGWLTPPGYAPALLPSEFSAQGMPALLPSDLRARRMLAPGLVGIAGLRPHPGLRR
jgi:hypothetical protein